MTSHHSLLEPSRRRRRRSGSGRDRRPRAGSEPTRDDLTGAVHRLARVGAVVPVTLGGVVLLGWSLGSRALTSVGAGLAPTVPLTAVMLLGLGASLMLYPPPRDPAAGSVQRLPGFALLPAAIAGLLAGVVLTEWATGAAQGIDLLLWGDRVVAIETAFPGRPSPGTAIAVLAAAVAVGLPFRRGEWWATISQVLAGVTGGTAAAALLGYLFDRVPVQVLEIGEPLTAVGVLTALGLGCVGFALLGYSAPRGLTRPAFSAGPGGALARRLLPPVLVVPPVFAAALLRIDWDTTSDLAGALAVFSVAVVVALAGLLLLAARRVDRIDRFVVMERQQRHLLDMARARAQLLAEVGAVVSRSTGLAESLTAVASAALPALGDAATVDLRRGGSVVRAVVVPGASSAWRPVRLVSNDPRQTALDTGDEAVLSGADPSIEPLWADVHVRPSPSGGAAVVPVTTARGRVAALTVVNAHDNVSSTDLLLLRELARRIALATDAREGMARFRAAFEQSVVGWALTQAREPDLGRFVEVNDRLCDLTGRGRQDLIGRTLASLIHEEHRDDLVGDLPAVAAGRRGLHSREVRLRMPDDRLLWAAVSVSCVTTDAPDAYLLVQVQDITDRRQAEAWLIEQALHDPLTGLANRTLLHERLEHAIDVHRRSDRSAAVLLMDLDGFKEINDTYGHDAGDDLLRSVADGLRATVRPGDTVARLGGDEFVVLLDPVEDEGEARTVAQRLHAALGAAVVVAGRPLQVSASIGVVLARGTDTAEGVLRQADVAMYRAKRDRNAHVAVVLREPGEETSADATVAVMVDGQASENEAQRDLAPKARPRTSSGA